MSAPQLKPIAVVRAGEAYNAYDAFLQALLKRRAELGISGETLDDITGQPTRYSQKLLEGRKVFGRKSFGDMLGGLAVGVMIFEDEAALELIQKRLEQSPLTKSQVRMQANACMQVPRWLFGPRKASQAAKKRWKDVPESKRRKHARMAARKRWRKPKVVEITDATQKAAILESQHAQRGAHRRPRADAHQPARPQGHKARPRQ